MQLKHVLIALLALPVGAAPIVSCAGGTRTVEIPDGPPGTKQKARRPPRDDATPPGQRRSGFLGRMFGSSDPNVGPCPLMGVLYESSRLVDFASADERYANIRFTGEVRGVRGLCRYVGADPITMNIEIDMAFGRGPAAADTRRRTYRYWVAVTRRGIAPIEKQYFDVEVEFPRDGNVVTRTEEIDRIVIPRATADLSGENFEILVGLELTPQQLQFNRDGKRFRIDAAG
jgi:hypothetical protein